VDRNATETECNASYDELIKAIIRLRGGWGEVDAGVVENLSSDDAEDFSVDHGDALTPFFIPVGLSQNDL
jgi:hypothetical protein